MQTKRILEMDEDRLKWLKELAEKYSITLSVWLGSPNFDREVVDTINNGIPVEEWHLRVIWGKLNNNFPTEERIQEWKGLFELNELIELLSKKSNNNNIEINKTLNGVKQKVLLTDKTDSLLKWAVNELYRKRGQEYSMYMGIEGDKESEMPYTEEQLQKIYKYDLSIKDKVNKWVVSRQLKKRLHDIRGYCQIHGLFSKGVKELTSKEYQFLYDIVAGSDIEYFSEGEKKVIQTAEQKKQRIRDYYRVKELSPEQKEKQRDKFLKAFRGLGKT